MNDKLAIIFPGQGSQKVGMLGDLVDKFPIISETYSAASKVLGYDLWQLTQQGPAEKLNQTEFTQPALLAAEVAAWKIWQQATGITPSFMAGHSLGEYAALVCAESLDFYAAIRLVAERGKLMQQAVAAGEGGMLAIIGLSPDEVQEVCHEAAQDDVLEPANYNAVGQIVVAGHLVAAKRAVDIAKQKGAKYTKLLEVSVPSHCILMKSAAEKLQELLTNIEIKAPSVPVLHNAYVAAYDDPDKIRDALVRQLYSPVRWVEIVKHLSQAGVGRLVECGPGRVLAGLNKRTVPELITASFI